MTMLLIVILFFIAILLGLAAVYSGYVAVRTSPAYELKKRLRKLALGKYGSFPAELKIEILSEMTPLDKFLYKFKAVRNLDKLMDNAGLKLDVKVFMLSVPICAASGFAIGLVLGKGIIFSYVLTIIGFFVPFIYLTIKRNQRLTRFTEQFPDAIDMVSRSLKAGHSFANAIQLVGSELSDPVAGLFRAAYDEQTLGLPLHDALFHMTERMKSLDLKFFVSAVNIHKEIGGNLSEILERLSQTIRERIRIRRQVRVYTAQARLSGYILAALPIAMALFFFFSTPGYIEELISEPIGKYAIAFAVVAQITGFLIIRKIINIRI